MFVLSCPVSRMAPWAPVLLLSLTMGIPALASAQLIINEVLAVPGRDWDGDGTFSFQGDEWVEVKNLGYEVVDLGGYALRDDHGDQVHLRLQGWLRDGEAKVFHGSEALAWQRDNGLYECGLALNDFGETIQLLHEIGQGDGATFEVVHEVTLQAHETATDRSSGWAEEGGGWEMFDAWNPYEGALVPGPTGCRPTPGDLNFCWPLVPTRPASLGRVKSLYR